FCKPMFLRRAAAEIPRPVSRDDNSADRPRPNEWPRRGAPSAQTAWIGSPAAPPASAGAAQDALKAGRCGPDRDCNHIDLPLGTGATALKTAGLPKRTRYVV